MWGAGGPFLLALAMVVAVVTPVVFCNKATENCNKNNKISCLDSIFLVLLHIVKHIAHVTLIVAWPEPELCSVASPNHFSPMEPRHIGYCQKALVIAEQLKGCTSQTPIWIALNWK
jgi:hypothetical protein